MNKQTRTELAFVFSQMHKKHLKLIPKDIRTEVMKEEKDMTLFKSFDFDKPFTKQNLSQETLEILADIFKDVPDDKF